MSSTALPTCSITAGALSRLPFSASRRFYDKLRLALSSFPFILVNFQTRQSNSIMKRLSGVNGVASTSLAPISASRPPPPERILSATSEGEPFSAEEDDERIADLARLRPKSPRTFGLFTSPRAKLNPFELEHDPTTAWAYRPSVLTCLGGLAGCVMLFAYHTENLVIPTRVSHAY